MQFLTFALALSTYASVPTRRFNESLCAATLAAAASDNRLTGTAAREQVDRLPDDLIDKTAFLRAQKSRELHVQTTILKGEAILPRLRTLLEEVERLDAEVVTARGERVRARWSSGAYLGLASLTATVTAAGLAVDPATWAGAVTALAGLGATAVSLEKFASGRIYLTAPTERPERVAKQIAAMIADLEVARAGRAPFIQRGFSVATTLGVDLVAEARLDGRVPLRRLVDSIDKNLIWAPDQPSPARPYVHVATQIALDTRSGGKPTLTTVTIFVPLFPIPRW